MVGAAAAGLGAGWRLKLGRGDEVGQLEEPGPRTGRPSRAAWVNKQAR